MGCIGGPTEPSMPEFKSCRGIRCNNPFLWPIENNKEFTGDIADKMVTKDDVIEILDAINQLKIHFDEALDAKCGN